MADGASIDGLAALVICESLLLALNDRNVMPEEVILEVLASAAKTLDSTEIGTGDTQTKTDAAKLIRKIIAGRNSVRRP